jgi:predicted transglutaminase-like cysteine proteinase
MKRLGNPFAKIIAACAVMAVCALIAAPQGMAATSKKTAPKTSVAPKIFGTKEVRTRGVQKFKKWTGVLQRYQGDRKKEARPCKPSLLNPCDIAKWLAFTRDVAKKPKRQQLDAVNAYMNKRRYIVDPKNYGKRDYWATPKQFFNKNGDCEDYAISKYISLLHAGFDPDAMRIVIVKDLNLKVAHGILVVYLDGEALVLDNQIPKVINAKRIRHYKPVYSINKKHWWRHRG